MRRKGLFHLNGARLESFEQIAMAPLKVLQHLGQQAGGGTWVERQDSIDDVVCPCLVRGVEVPWFGRRLQRTHEDSCWIGAQIQTLSVQEFSG